MHILSLVFFFFLSLVQQSMIIAWKMEQFQNNGVRMPLIYVCVPQAEKDILTVPYMSVWLSSDKNAKKEVSSKLNWIYNVIKYYWNTWKEKKKVSDCLAFEPQFSVAQLEFRGADPVTGKHSSRKHTQIAAKENIIPVSTYLTSSPSVYHLLFIIQCFPSTFYR